MRLLLFLALVASLDASRPASACTLLPPFEQQLDPAYANDTVAPSSVVASAEVSRSEPDDGCDQPENTCGKLASIGLTVHATDDAAPADKLGYQLRVVGGELPVGAHVPNGPVVATNGDLSLNFQYDDRSGFSVDLEIRARDLNGNLGPPTVITVSEPGDSGCSTGRTPLGHTSTLGGVLVALAVVLRRRRSAPV